MPHVMQTVYSPGALTDPPVWRAFRQVVLPIMDLLFVLFGLSSFIVGSKIVEDFAHPWFRPVWAAVIFLGAFVALGANIVLWSRLEFFARLGFLAGLVIYAVATVAYMLQGNDSAFLTLVFIAARALGTGWRMWWIALDIGKEEADREVIASRTGGTPIA